MAAEMLAIRLEFALGVASVAVGAVMALSSTNAAKRVMGLLIGHLAALMTLSVLHAGSAAMLAGLAIALASLLLGVALLVRLQEAYNGVEAPELDAADAQSEPAEPVA